MGSAPLVQLHPQVLAMATDYYDAHMDLQIQPGKEKVDQTVNEIENIVMNL